jgi:hypothetical protein
MKTKKLLENGKPSSKSSEEIKQEKANNDLPMSLDE